MDTPYCKTFFGSRRSKELRNQLGDDLHSTQVGLYQLGVDWFSFFEGKRQRLTTGMVGIKAIDLPDTHREHREGHLILMLMPGPDMVKSVRAYIALIVKDFQHCLDVGGIHTQRTSWHANEIGVEALRNDEVTHLPILVSVVADNPARQKVAELRGHAAERACGYCWMRGSCFEGKTVFLGYTAHEVIEPSDIPTRHLRMALRVKVGDRRALKSKEEMVQAGRMVQDGLWSEDMAGCNGLSPIASLPYINYKEVWGLGIAHILLLGLVPNFVDRILPKKVQGLPSYAIQVQGRETIKQRSAALRMPIGRQKPLCLVSKRGCFEISHWWLHTK